MVVAEEVLPPEVEEVPLLELGGEVAAVAAKMSLPVVPVAVAAEGLYALRSGRAVERPCRFIGGSSAELEAILMARVEVICS